MDAEPIESDDSNAVTPPQTTNNHTPKPDLDGRISSHRGSESRDSHSVHHGDEDSRISMQSGGTPGDSPQNTPNAALPTFQVSLSLNSNAKKKKLVSDVFQNDDDQEEMNGPKKRKLVPLGKIFPVRFVSSNKTFLLFQTMMKTQLQNKRLQIPTHQLKQPSHKRPPVSLAPIIVKMRRIAKKATKKNDVTSKASSIKFRRKSMRCSTIPWTKQRSTVQSRKKSDLGSTKRSSSTLANRNPLSLISFVPKFWPVVPHKVF